MGTRTKWHSARDIPNLFIHRQVVTRQAAKARGEIKLESYTWWQRRPFAFKYV